MAERVYVKKRDGETRWHEETAIRRDGARDGETKKEKEGGESKLARAS